MSATADGAVAGPGAAAGTPAGAGPGEGVGLRVLLAASVGNAVEWLDWMVYATFAVFFSSQFFPASNPTAALLGTTGTFALAFFFRPLGGVLLGRLADTRGRRAAMVASILMMSGASLGIALLPTHDQVGLAAPVLLLLLRIVQAVSVGGEIANASAYLAEVAPPGRRGRYASVFYLTSGVCLLLSSGSGVLLTSLLDDGQMREFGWRLAFGVAALVGLAGLWLRRSLVETEPFRAHGERARRLRAPLRATLRRCPGAVARLCGLTLLGTLGYYTLFSALTPYAVRFQGADAQDALIALTIGTGLFTALQYPLGALSDRVGRRVPLLVWAGGFAVATVPLSMLTTGQPSTARLTVVFCVGLALYSLQSSIVPAVMSELFPTELRALGIGAWYNLTVAVFGGTAPLLVTALGGAGLPGVFFWYVSAAAVVALVTVATMPETGRRPLS